MSAIQRDRQGPQYPLEDEAEVLEMHDCVDAGGRTTQDDYKEVIGRKRLEQVF